MPEVGKDTEKLELSHIASRNEEWHKNVRKSFSVSYKIYFYIYSMTREFPTQYFPPKNENIWPQRDLYKNIQRSFILNSPKLELVQMFINRKMDKHIVVYS